MKKSTGKDPDPVLAELILIKKLMVFSILSSGVSQRQLAKSLGVDHSRISRMFPGGVGNISKEVS